MKQSDEMRQQWLMDISLGLRDEFNLNESDALHRANNLMDRLSERMPAGNYYWPGQNKTKRNQDILRSLQTMSVAATSKKFNISVQRVYSIRSNAMKKRNEKAMAERAQKK